MYNFQEMFEKNNNNDQKSYRNFSGDGQRV